MNQFQPANAPENRFAPDAADVLLQVFVGPESSAGLTSALPQELVDSFAAATGWELALVGDDIKIVDMSQSWPARTPTAHRGKCDQFARELSKVLFNSGSKYPS